MVKNIKRFVISLGGSLIVPSSGIDIKFLSKFNRFIREKIVEHPNWQFFIVAGGGSIARNYRDAGKSVIGKSLTSDDLDWLGIHATRLNAHLLRTIFRDIAHPVIIKDYDIKARVAHPVVVAAGWKPGFSTDFDAVLLCEYYGADLLINMSNIKMVFDKDPSKYKDARPIAAMSWREYRALIGDKWSPGMHAPVDPVAARKAEKMGLKVIIVDGRDFKNFRKVIDGKKFIGTMIR